MHANQATLQSMYSQLSRFEVETLLAAVSDGFKFEVSGKSPLAGKHSKSEFTNYVNRLRELAGDSLTLDIHDIMASDQHGLVLLSVSLTRDGTKHAYRTVHVWRFENGTPVAGYEYPRDLYAFDRIWS